MQWVHVFYPAGDLSRKIPPKIPIMSLYDGYRIRHFKYHVYEIFLFYPLLSVTLNNIIPAINIAPNYKLKLKGGTKETKGNRQVKK
jgi:hypothetical protein